MIDSLLLAYTALSAFLGGVALGWLLAAQRQTRKGQMPASTTSEETKSSFTARDLTLMLLVLVALAVNGAVGFLQIENGRQDRQRVECSIDYNERLGLALDERTQRSQNSTMTEIELWQNLSGALDQNPTSPQGAVSSQIEDYVGELRASQRSRIENPYPPADLCQDGARR